MALTLHCPICRTKTVWEGNPHRPFCSERCRIIDLGQWASESYRVPDETLPDDTGRDHPEDEA